MLLITLAVMVSLLFSSSCNSPQTHRSDEIILVGVVEKMGTDAGATSGVFAIYRLVKYKVEAVCVGKYGQAEILVDHLIVTGEEVKHLKVGNRVCVLVKRSAKIFTRTNEDGLRGDHEKVKEFYIGGPAKVIPPEGSTKCPCTP